MPLSLLSILRNNTNLIKGPYLLLLGVLRSSTNVAAVVRLVDIAIKKNFDWHLSYVNYTDHSTFPVMCWNSSVLKYRIFISKIAVKQRFILLY